MPFGAYGDARKVVELAEAAEESGWEALLVWDHLLFPYGVGDPWVALAAVAAKTEKNQRVVKKPGQVAMR